MVTLQIPAPISSLFAFDKPLEQIIADLNNANLEVSASPIPMSINQLASVLERYIGNAITSEDLEKWANEVARLSVYNVVYPERNEQVMRSVIHTLSNPYLGDEISVPLVQELLKQVTGEIGNASQR